MTGLLQNAGWSLLTIAAYAAAKTVHRCLPRWWSAPLALTPALLIVVALLAHERYADYIRGTHWLVLLMGPATAAFAVPIYEHRHLARRHWRVLLLGMVMGSTVSVASAWALATLLGLDGSLRMSLLPRSISTPFAMTVAQDIGGRPDLTAVFVVFTGVLGGILGDRLLRWLPLRSSLARGALLGMGAHGAGVAKAHQLGAQEAAVAGLVMVLVGVLNVLLATVLMALRG